MPLLANKINSLLHHPKCVLPQSGKKRCYLVLFGFFISLMGQAQGSWNMGYIQIDSIGWQHIGKTVRLDFNRTGSRVSQQRGTIRTYFLSQDTGMLIIDGKSLPFVEVRKIYPDHGEYNKQYLKLLEGIENTIEAIWDVKLIAVLLDSLQVEADVQLKRNDYRGRAETQHKTFWVDRKQLDGLIIKL